ncbi:MAG: phosphatidate cytidylyltransferase [Deltaproteobacteria bacterium]|nr:phosphatidate cytidylyltransferase [Deltaproteobacteria bacterium]
MPLLAMLIGFAPPFWFAVAVMVLAAWGLFEFYAICLPKRRTVEKTLAILAGALLTWLPLWQNEGGAQLVWVGTFYFFALVILFHFQDLRIAMADFALLICGLFYIPLLLGYLNLLMKLPQGRCWIFLTLMAIMANDSLAYFAGSRWGRHPLYPAISAKKTWEGLAGGLAGSLIGVLLAKYAFLPVLSFSSALLLAVILGFVGPLGDLFESMLKRSYGVKDSGCGIPGHGGLLDRLDSLLFAFPAVYSFCMWHILS